MDLQSYFKIRGLFWMWVFFFLEGLSLKQNTFNLGYFCPTPTALIVAVLKAIVQFCSGFELFKIRFDSKIENPKEPSGYLLTGSAFVSSWPVAQWDWHVPMAWECQVLQSLTLSPLLHVHGCSLVMALMACSGWKPRDGNVLPRFAFLSASFWRSPVREKKRKQ